MVPISVNFAGEKLRHENITGQMRALIEKYQVLCEYLEVEVSESYTDTNQEMLAASCSKIRKANVRVVLDHFGAKNSSFSILSPTYEGSDKPVQIYRDRDNVTTLSLPED